MFYLYGKLNRRIDEVCGSSKEFARRMGKPVSTINRKLINGMAFTTAEIEAACRILRIEPTEIDEYFFHLRPQIDKNLFPDPPLS